jgi:hypothetical protein
MGMYTKFKVVTIVKNLYISFIEEIINGKYSFSDIIKEENLKEFEFIPGEIKKFIEEDVKSGGRIDHIPGNCNYFDKESGLWIFSVEIKNYWNTIENFMPILGFISKKIIYAHNWYEENKKPRVMIGDKITTELFTDYYMYE